MDSNNKTTNRKKVISAFLFIFLTLFILSVVGLMLDAIYLNTTSTQRLKKARQQAQATTNRVKMPTIYVSAGMQDWIDSVTQRLNYEISFNHARNNALRNLVLYYKTKNDIYLRVANQYFIRQNSYVDSIRMFDGVKVNNGK